MKIAYKHLLKFLNESPSEEDLSRKLFQLGHENDFVNGIFDIEVTPNRGDCLSLLGIARDLNVFYTLKNNTQIMNEPIESFDLNFVNNAANDCPSISFLNIEIEGEIKEYKPYLSNYFKDMGINKNNFFTDVSNYLAYEVGQPTHCYDFSKLDEPIEFNKIEKDFEFKTLLGKKINLTGKNCVFISNGQVINLAGVMGGIATACDKNTKNVLVECAYFRPEAIIGKTVKYDINSDAAYKFERGVDPDMQEFSLRRFIQIVDDHSQIKRLGLYRNKFADIPSKKINFNVENINNILGINISKLDYSKYLERLGLFVQNEKVQIPNYRYDITNENDLAEEVARVIGYNNIKPKEFRISKKPNKVSLAKEDFLRDMLVDNGFNEVINIPFTSVRRTNSPTIDNPLDSNKRFLRVDLEESLLENLLYNENRQHDSIKLFEISDLYNADNKQESDKFLCLIVSGRVAHNFREFSKKLDKEYIVNLFKNAEISIKNNLIKEIPRHNLKTKLKNKIYLLEISVKDLPDSIFNYQRVGKTNYFSNKYEKISEFPSSTRDVSFMLVNQYQIKELEDILLGYKSKNVKKVFVFDFYKKDNNQIKIGFRFVFQSLEKTLNIEEIDKELSNIISKTDIIEGIKVPGLEKR